MSYRKYKKHVRCDCGGWATFRGKSPKEVERMIQATDWRLLETKLGREKWVCPRCIKEGRK